MKVPALFSVPAYYCHRDRAYGQAKEGKCMSESDAMAQGLHAAGGKRCTG
jgi:hypothetical protein